MKENETQFNTNLDEDLVKRVKHRIADTKGTTLKSWTTEAFELALNFEAVAEEHCRSLGWFNPAEGTKPLLDMVDRALGKKPAQMPEPEVIDLGDPEVLSRPTAKINKA